MHFALDFGQPDQFVELVEQRVEGGRGFRRLARQAAERRRIGRRRVRRWCRTRDRRRAQVLEQHATEGVELVETSAVRYLAERADGVADPERGFVVGPGVRGPRDAVVLDELREDRRNGVDEARVASYHVGLAQRSERSARDLVLERAERAPEREELAVAEMLVGAHEAGRELAGLGQQPVGDAVAVEPVRLGPLRDSGLQALDELADGAAQRAVVAGIGPHLCFIVRRPPFLRQFVTETVTERRQNPARSGLRFARPLAARARGADPRALASTRCDTSRCGAT